MTEPDERAILVRFFKALADESRLKIVGLLADGGRAVEDLAAHLGLESPTVSHHLRVLSGAGLVRSHGRSHQRIYELNLDHLQATARELLTHETLPRLSAGTGADAYERKVLATFVTDGRIEAFPSQRKKQLVLLRWAVERFEPDRRYSEQAVNETLAALHEDTARLRRGLVDEGLMAREGGGGAYWRTSKADLPPEALWGSEVTPEAG
ncbi:MAG: metalloregulator ArsR/SmtB family transcription factor [Trueperaceae bacterium]|nr:metalloregulator ArsR/SmtB family transcription factor [Trueperaceae bacterium]